MKVKVIITNRFGDWTTDALARRLDMSLTESGNFVGMLTPEQVAEVRESGVEYDIDWKTTSN